MALIVIDEPYMDTVKEFAKKIGMLGNLEKALDRLSNFGEGETNCHIGKDFAPNSFAFRIDRHKEDGWKPWLYGGLIFHGEHDGGGNGGSPTFSTNLTPTTGWAIHT